MSGRPLRLTPWLVLLGLSVAVPTGLAAVDPDDLLNQGDKGQGQDPDPQGPVNPSKIASDLQRDLEEGGGAGDGSNVPAPPFDTERGVEGVAPAVIDALVENWLLTTVITGGLAASAAAGYALASRYIDPRIALRSPERSMLYGFIKGNPGVHLKQLSTEFRMKTSTVLWHVRKLESADLIRSKKANGYRVFYPVSGGLEASKVSEAVTALSNANARSIFEFIAGRPGVPFRAMVESLPINPGTIRWHLKKLRTGGLLEEAPDAAGASMRPTELGLKAWGQVAGLPQTVPVSVVGAGGESLQAEEIEVAG